MAKKKDPNEPPKRRGRPPKNKTAVPPPPPSAPPPPVVVGPQDRPLDDEERRFVNEYLIDLKHGAAYHRCYPEVTYRQAIFRGLAMKRRPNVRVEIQAAIRAQQIRAQVRADDVVDELRRCATSDILDLFDPQTSTLRMPRQIPIDTRRAIASVKVSRERRTRMMEGTVQTTVSESVVEYKLWPKVEALSKLATHFGLNQAIPPLDVLLSLLPADVANTIREAIARRLLPATASTPVPVQEIATHPKPPETPK